MENIGYIYKITSPTGRVYVGQTTNIKNRMSEHRRCRGNNKILYGSIRKYGWDAHQVLILDEVAIDKINTAECFYIAICNSYVYTNKNVGMNLTLGGEGATGLVYTDEMRKNASLRRIGVKLSEEHKRNISRGSAHTPHNEKQKEILREAREKQWGNPEYVEKFMKAAATRERTDGERKKMSETIKKLWQNEEYRNRIINNRTYFKHTEETKKKIGDKIRGRKMSAETIKKMSEARTKYYKQKRENSQ